MKIDAVEQRTGNLGLVFLGAFRRPAAALGWIVEIAAAASPRCLFAIWCYHIEIVQTTTLQGGA